MTTFKVKALDSRGMFTNWFTHAVHEAMCNVADYRTYEAAFMTYFGLRIITTVSETDQPVEWFVEFPDEGEATMFILRWS